jgi:hypothetical protein
MWIFASLAALAQDPALDVHVSAPAADQVRISFRTVESQSAVCPLRVNRLTLDVPSLDKAGRAVDGAIELDAAVDDNAICLMIIGPQTGSITFGRGREMPDLQVGRYALSINGTDYGTLFVGDTTVKLDAP